MLYIVTYATHSNKYIETLKESCPDLIILEDTDSKINEIIKFCKSKKKDDIICVIDSFNIVVLSSKSEIEEKFNSLNCDLCFSKDIVPKTILEKYIQYKSLNKYNRSDLNSSMYIGKAHSIINFWNSNSKNYKIDVDNIIFNSCIITSPETDVPDIKSKFWLSVGTIEPRKNQLRLIEAYAKYLKLGGVPYPLVFAGGKGWLMEGFEKKIRDLGIDSNVILAGYTSDEELIWLYRNCFANLYPSFFEGFGLPVLEGMQFGAVTLTSKTSSLPEVAGNSALLLNPYDVDEWANEMLKLSINDSQRMFLKAASIDQAEKFNWKNSASQLIELYDEAHTMPKRIYKI